MSKPSFWERKGIPTGEPGSQPAQQPVSQSIEIDQVALAEIQENGSSDVFEDEDADMAEVLSDANLRLEQGRLYQMIMNSDIFKDTDAEPKAIKNVQREIRRFARERMETMLGMRQEETAATQTIVSSPFNDMEVEVLKILASKMSKGATEQQTSAQVPTPAAAPKKDGITPISGNSRPKASLPSKQTVAPVQANKAQSAVKAQPVSAKTQLPKLEEESSLKKPISEMTPQELVEYEKAASERRSRKTAALPNNMVPMPNAQQLEALYVTRASNMPIKLVPPSE